MYISLNKYFKNRFDYNSRKYILLLYTPISPTLLQNNGKQGCHDFQNQPGGGDSCYEENFFHTINKMINSTRGFILQQTLKLLNINFHVFRTENIYNIFNKKI